VTPRLTLALPAAALALANLLAAPALAAEAEQSADDQGDIDLAQLLNISIAVASLLPETVLEAPGTVVVITEEDIQRHGWINLREVLAAVPNMDLMWQWNWLCGGQRGFTGNFSSTLLLIDGREVQNLLAGESFITSAFSAHRIKRVEILEGPNSTQYGPNALEGIINIVTKHGPEGQNQLDLQYVQGEVGTSQFAGVARTSGDGYSLGLSASYYTTDQSYKRLADFNADTERYSRDPLVDKWRVLRPSHFALPEESVSLDAYATYKSLYAGVNFFKIVNTEGLEIVKWNFVGHESRRQARHLFAGIQQQLLPDVTGQLEYRYTSEIDSTLDAYPQMPETWMTPADIKLPIGSDVFVISRHRALARLTLKLADWSHLVAGYDFNSTNYHYYEEPHDAVQPTRDVAHDAWNFDDRREQSVFIEDTASFFDGHVRAVAGVRYTAPWNVDPTFLPRASLIVKPTMNSAIKFTYGQGYRGPNMWEILGTKDLPPITMTMYELNGTLQHTFDSGFELSNTLVGYHMLSQNQYVSVQAPDGNTMNTVVNSSHAVRGVEDMLQLHFRGFRAFAGLRYIDPDRDEVAGRFIVRDVPITKGKLGVSLQPWRYVQASLFLDYWAKVDTDANVPVGAGEGVEVYRVPAWAALHGFVRGGNLSMLSLRGSLGLYVENITNALYYNANTRGTSPVQYVQAPRNFRLQAEFAF
jgi:outer membrane receptor protein involved in Fe transport